MGCCPLAENITLLLLLLLIWSNSGKKSFFVMKKNTYACAKMSRLLSRHLFWFTGSLHCKILMMYKYNFTTDSIYTPIISCLHTYAGLTCILYFFTTFLLQLDTTICFWINVSVTVRQHWLVDSNYIYTFLMVYPCNCFITAIGDFSFCTHSRCIFLPIRSDSIFFFPLSSFFFPIYSLFVYLQNP